MQILFVSSEAAPFAKVGGLADVVGSLPVALTERGVDARLILPKYGVIPAEYTSDMEFMESFSVFVGGKEKYVGLFRLPFCGTTVYFIDNEEFFGDSIYGYGEFEAEKNVYFAYAVLASLDHMGDFKPDILHCNDWQTALLPVLLKDASSPKTVLTVHNLKYQGQFSIDLMRHLTGLSDDFFTSEVLEFYGEANMLKAGLLHADKITTVSPQYAKETLLPAFGERLENILAYRAADYQGIINGIDYAEYNPGKDPFLPARYTMVRPENKAICKADVQERLGLALSKDTPLVTLISRLVDQKGLDLIAECMDDVLRDTNMKLAILGTGDPYYEEMFRKLALVYPGRVSATIAYSNELAHRMYAGADLFLMPSLFEPCGLAQMIAMRYGTVPLVRETGGLADTVEAYNEAMGKGFGFSFASYEAQDLANTLRYALSCYEDKELWSKLMRRCMRRDFSWNQSAGQYLELYRQMLA
jgi:starch synthase